MKKTTLVAILLLMSSTAFSSSIIREINKIESEWAQIYYSQNDQEQKDAYPKLIDKTNQLITKHPKSVELSIWKAILISTNAEFENPFTALKSINIAKNLLESSIQKQPKALDGAAFVVLGTLYYMTPSWPISFGNQSKAEQLLKKGLEMNPNSIDANYFYADYLLSKNKIKKASKYFKLALNTPVRSTQQYADKQLKNEALTALKNTEQRILESGKNKFLSLFSSAQKK